MSKSTSSNYFCIILLILLTRIPFILQGSEMHLAKASFEVSCTNNAKEEMCNSTTACGWNGFLKQVQFICSKVWNGEFQCKHEITEPSEKETCKKLMENFCKNNSECGFNPSAIINNNALKCTIKIKQALSTQSIVSAEKADEPRNETSGNDANSNWSNNFTCIFICFASVIIGFFIGFYIGFCIDCSCLEKNMDHRRGPEP